ncbi:MAG TPA: hypothetical protein VGN74_02480 [Brevundimonas sp.]|jgi:hypothetical protein|uniref:hypothetical protein n=1 Tax=Brevundimonas sp. TaxID=1871086 RepID=UPI002E0DADE5|nr:hypothetical protein [Brevundimonas sp.]
MRRKDIAQTVASHLFRTEAALDAALEEAALMIARISQLRREHGYSAVLGHDAVAAISRSVEALGQARSHAMAAHASLAQEAASLGVSPTHLQGNGTNKPPETRPTAPTGQDLLTLVA